MSRKGIYRSVKIKDVSFESLASMAKEKGGEKGMTVGLDIAKEEIVVVLRWPDGSFERPISVANPLGIGELAELLCMLREACKDLTIGLESTGTYGEAVRFAMTKASLEVHRVSGKGVSDYREVFDRVPSQHDGKDAAMIAELTAFGKGTPWPYRAPTEAEQERQRHVARLTNFQKQAQQWIGRLEAILARHWPELTSLLALDSATLLNICRHYGSPAKLASEDQSCAKAQLRKWGRSKLSYSKIQEVLTSARFNVGVPLGSGEEAWLKEVVGEIQKALVEVRVSRRALTKDAKSDPTMKNYVEKVGGPTLCVIWTTVGDPRKYSSSGAFLKALGLNLKELSSGNHKGVLAITKRGPGPARKALYFWALRAIQQPEIKAWYNRFTKVGRGKSDANGYRKMKGLVAVMRKLARSLWYVCQHDLPFSYANVFPEKPLQKRKKRRTRRRTQVPVPAS
jgi:transposase